MAEELIFVNGISAKTGKYLIEPLELTELVAMIRAQPLPQTEIDRAVALQQKVGDPHLGLPDGVNPEDVAEAGWGVVFHEDEAPDVREALQPLVEHRRKSTVAKVLGDYRPGDTMSSWLARHGVGQGSVLPKKVPFYLLIAGDPARIPFEFGHHLSGEYAVGRLHFDTPAEYRAYVRGVIEYETAPEPPNTKEVVYWAPRHPADPNTQLSADHLVKPLANGIAGEQAIAQTRGFAAQSFIGAPATKSALLNTLRAKASPAVLFTASHGAGWEKTDPEQREKQGALVCQGWMKDEPVPDDLCVSAQDITAETRVHGLVAFCFACFGAGTPDRDQFTHKAGKLPPEIAPTPFLARLPQRLLAHPNGGALAVIGHVDRAFGYSIVAPGAGDQIQPFRNCLSRLLRGAPLGLALKDFKDKYNSTSTTLAGKLRQMSFGIPFPAQEISSNWVERNDAEAYVLLGDPAVRIRTQDRPG